MLKILILFYAIGFCYATSNCHELQKSQLASLNDRITQMLNSLYKSPIIPKSQETTPSSSATTDTPTNEYANNPYESNYSNYPPLPFLPPQVVYVTSTHTPAILGPPALYAPLPATFGSPPPSPPAIYGPPPATYAPHPATYAPPPATYAPPPATYTPPPATYAPPPATYAPPPATYAPPPSMALAALSKTQQPTMALPAPMNAPPAIFTPPIMHTTIPYPAPPTSSQFYHLESKGQHLDPYRNVLAQKYPNFYYEHQYPSQYPSIPSPYSLSSPPTYSTEYSPSFPEYPAPLQYSSKPIYPPTSMAYSAPQGYLPNLPIPYPPIYPKQYELPPPSFYM